LARGFVAIIVPIAASLWISSCTSDSRSTAAASFAVRTTYWRALAQLPRSRWILGAGPAMFVVDGTTQLALLRAEQPHVLGGSLDRSAHSEWLQAFYELGVPGGVAYLALPIGAIVAAGLRFRRAAPGLSRALVACFSAGLVAIVVTEAASINLRYSILPGWYWTLLGLTVAASRTGSVDRPISAAWLPRPAIIRFAVAGLGVAVLLMVVNDAPATYAHAIGRPAIGRDP